MDRENLESVLAERFGADADAVRVVGRQARDLADAGHIEADLGFEITVTAIIDNLDDAPDSHGLVERWNWWLGSLELSHGGYEQFRIRPGAVE